MRILFTIPKTNINLVDSDRSVFSIGQGHYLDINGKPIPEEESFHTSFIDAEEDDQRMHQEKADYIASVCDGLESFSDQEIEWEIDDAFGHFGFKDKAGNIVIEPQYAWVHDFSHGLCAVNLGRTWYHTPEGKLYYENHYGYINTKGKTVIPFQFEDAHSFNKFGVAVVSDDTGTYMIDTTGKEIPGTRFPAIEGRIDYEERYIEFSNLGMEGHERNNTWGLYDTKERKIICPPCFDCFICWEEDLIEVSASVEGNPFIQHSWYIDSSGVPVYEWLRDRHYHDLKPPDDNGNFVFGMIKMEKATKEQAGHSPYQFTDGKQFYKKTYYYGLVAAHGEVLLVPEYEAIVYLGNGMYACDKDNKTIVMRIEKINDTTNS